MACGCNKKRTSNRQSLLNKGKKTAAKRGLPLVTIRKRLSATKSSTKKK
jgi:hypothetical protein